MSEESMVRGLASESETSYDELVSISDDSSDLSRRFLKAKLDKQQEEIENLKQDRDQRKKFSYIIFFFMCAYVLAVLVIIYLCGFRVMNLDKSVMITLLSTALANVIGVFTFVAKYLFHNK